MKKVFLIVVLFIFYISNAYADKEYLKNFNKFLSNNTKFISENGIKGLKFTNICKEEKKFSKKWMEHECEFMAAGVFEVQNNLKIKFYKDRNNIPWGKEANFDTLFYYGFASIDDDSGFKDIGSKNSNEPYKFSFNLREDKDVKKEINQTGLLSYLLYEDGKIVIDEMSPKDRFGKVYTNETQFHSQSVGKSLASYILGHAICKGYVGNIDSKINDWPIIKNSIYHDQKIIDIINMAVGDQAYFSKDNPSNRYKTGRSVSNTTPKKAMENEFKELKPSKKRYAYNNFLPHLILNYVIFKMGEEKYQELMEDIFRKKIGIEHGMFFVEPETSEQGDRSTTTTFLATRYDYLRMSKAMLDDWQNDTCEGKYLKSLFERKIKKNQQWENNKDSFGLTKYYAGFFHTGLKGMKNRPIFIMDGYGGQIFTIDFERARIVATIAIHRDFNWKKMGYSVIKKGK